MNRTSRTLASLALAVLFALSLSSCGQESPATTTAGTSLNPVEVMLNDHEKVANEYVRVAKKLKDGDVSLTVRYIELDNRTRAGSAKLQQVSAKMTPQQVKRLASISARTAPYLQN